MNFEQAIHVIENKRITAYEIHKATGLNEAGVRRILNKEVDKPQRKTKEAIIKFVENSNIPIQDNIINDPESIYITKEKRVPYYDVDFTAGFLTVTNNQQMTPDHYVTHPFFKGCDFIVRASGQSMAKIIKHGDAIGLIEIKDWRDFLPLGEIYAIVTTNGFRMIKVISEGKEKGSYTLISKPSENKITDFPPQQIEKKHILHIYKVQASSHLF